MIEIPASLFAAFPPRAVSPWFVQTAQSTRRRPSRGLAQHGERQTESDVTVRGNYRSGAGSSTVACSSSLTSSRSLP